MLLMRGEHYSFGEDVSWHALRDRLLKELEAKELEGVSPPM